MEYWIELHLTDIHALHRVPCRASSGLVRVCHLPAKTTLVGVPQKHHDFFRSHTQSVECAFAAGDRSSCRGLARQLPTGVLCYCWLFDLHSLYEPKAHFTAGHTLC